MNKNNKVILEYQYFEGCPNHKKMEENLKAAIIGLEDKIDLVKATVEDEETAIRVSFRGSPTLLINGEDIEGIPAPESPSLSCRFYPEGIPSSEIIRKKILLAVNN